MKNNSSPRLFLVASSKGRQVHRIIQLMEPFSQGLYRIHTSASSILFATEDEHITPAAIMRHAAKEKCRLMVLELDARVLAEPGACCMSTTDGKALDAFRTVSLAMKKERYTQDGPTTQRLVDRILDRIARKGFANVLNIEIRLLDHLARHL